MPMKTMGGPGGMKGDMCRCQHHSIFGWAVLIVGLIYLLTDLKVWSQWWPFQWYTVLFVLLGLAALCKCCDRRWF